METSSKSLRQQLNYTVKILSPSSELKKLIVSYRLVEKIQVHYQLELDSTQKPLYNGKGWGGEAHQVPLPCVMPKCRAGLFLELLPCGALQQQGPSGCLLRALLVSGN